MIRSFYLNGERMRQNRNEMRLSFCKGDIVVIGFVLMLAVLTGILCWIKTGSQKGTTAIIYKNGEKVQELSLKENTEVLITNDYTNRMEIKDGKVAITKSDCPGEDCVHSGWISESGRSIVCLPNRVEIRIEGEGEVDFVVH